jgi:PemK-like, MazF-like toxin of type II toxin-antitoxin system
MKPGAIHEIESLVPMGGKDAMEFVLTLHDDDAFLHESPMVLVVPLAAPPSEPHGHALVKIAATAQSGLQKPMVAVMDRLHGVDRDRIGNRIGEIDRSVLIDVYRVLDRLIGRAAPVQRPSHSGDTRHTEL